MHAYEVRISDWSSDVCSSDLYYGYSLALGSAEVTLMQQVAAFRSLEQGGRWSPLRLAEDDPEAEPRAITTPAAAWIVGDMLADPTARVATRSEEHTSELQSLMRISYAVFCLKKKTNNTPYSIGSRNRARHN